MVLPIFLKLVILDLKLVLAVLLLEFPKLATTELLACLMELKLEL